MGGGLRVMWAFFEGVFFMLFGDGYRTRYEDGDGDDDDDDDDDDGVVRARSSYDDGVDEKAMYRLV